MLKNSLGGNNLCLFKLQTEKCESTTYKLIAVESWWLITLSRENNWILSDRKKCSQIASKLFWNHASIREFNELL